VSENTITGAVIRDSLKSFLKTSYVVFAQSQHNGWENFTTRSPLISGNIQLNHQQFLSEVIDKNEKLSANDAKELVHEIIRRLNAVDLLEPCRLSFTLNDATVAADVYSLSTKGFELALQYKQIDDNNKNFDRQLNRTHWAIAIAVGGSLLTALATLTVAFLGSCNN